jgi:hypothetical protein
MNRNLPEWVQSPFVIVPFFAVCVSIPLLIGISDRAAQFAGGLTAALAAVIAVVLTGQVQRANERAREHRAHAREMRALALEIALHLAMTKVDGKRIEKTLCDHWLKSPRRTISGPTVLGPPNAIWKVLVVRSFPSLPNRIEEKLCATNQKVAQSIFEIYRLVAVLKDNLDQEIAYPPSEQLDQNRAYELSKICSNIVSSVEVAEHILNDYRTEIEAFAGEL